MIALREGFGVDREDGYEAIVQPANRQQPAAETTTAKSGQGFPIRLFDRTAPSGHGISQFRLATTV